MNAGLKNAPISLICRRHDDRTYGKNSLGCAGKNKMDEIPWYSEASLYSQGHVHCAGTLVQCIRRWRRLPEISQQSSYLKLAREFGGKTRLAGEELANLATQADLTRL
jgi:hypothetical protein